MKNIYIQNEAKKGFKDWTKQGLEFLLLHPCINSNIKIKAQQKLDVFISIVTK